MDETGLPLFRILRPLFAEVAQQADPRASPLAVTVPLDRRPLVEGSQRWRNKGALQAFFQASPKVACFAPSSPNRVGMSRQGTPVRNFQITASTNRRLPRSLLRPTYPGRPRQQLFYSCELVVSQSVAVHLEASERRLPMNHAFTDLRIRWTEKITSHNYRDKYRFG